MFLGVMTSQIFLTSEPLLHIEQQLCWREDASLWQSYNILAFSFSFCSIKAAPLKREALQCDLNIAVVGKAKQGEVFRNTISPSKF